MSLSFKDLPLSAPLQKALEGMAFNQPTEIQSKTIPLLLNAPRMDFHGQAQTGTGKTLAFGIPLLEKINPDVHAVQALIVAPTRELVVQICQSLRKVAEFMNLSIHPIYGGMGMSEQIKVLKQGVHVVIGTPGRLNDHLRRKTLSLQKLKILVLDEADIMLDMGFKEEVDEILAHAPADRQIWLFSATVKPGIDHIKKTHMNNPMVVSVSKQQVSSNSTKQYYCIVPTKIRIFALARFIDSTSEFYGFVFCQTKAMTIEVVEQLVKMGYKAGALHGDMSQDQRNKTIKKFRNREFTVLVATDIAARGIDITDITHVINYSLPNDQESYIHRIGRTGRAGKEGIAITFMSKTEQFRVAALKKRFRVTLDAIEVPSDKELLSNNFKKIEDIFVSYQKESSVDAADEIGQTLTTLIDRYDEKLVKSMLASLLKEKHFKQFSSKSLKIEMQSSSEKTFALQDDLQELCLNVGADDGINKLKVIDYLKAHSKAPEDAIAKIRVIKRRTFLVVNAAHVPTLMKDLNGHTLKGRTVRVQMA